MNPASIAWVSVGSFIGSFGALYLKIGSGHLSRNLRSLLTNWRLAVGVGTYLVSSVLFVKGMSNGELSVLFPLVSLGNVCTLAWSRLFFHEPITKVKLAGVGLILIGITCLGLGGR